MAIKILQYLIRVLHFVKNNVRPCKHPGQAEFKLNIFLNIKNNGTQWINKY